MIQRISCPGLTACFFKKISFERQKSKGVDAGSRQQKKEMSSGENDKNVRVTFKNEAQKMVGDKHSSHDESCPASLPPTHEEKAHLSLAAQSARIPPLQSLFKNIRTSFFSLFSQLELNSSTILSTSS